MPLYTYIHNWFLLTFSQDYDIGSHTTYIVCVNEWRDLQFKVDSERQIFEKLFYIYSYSFCQKSAERKDKIAKENKNNENTRFLFTFFIRMLC